MISRKKYHNGKSHPVHLVRWVGTGNGHPGSGSCLLQNLFLESFGTERRALIWAKGLSALWDTPGNGGWEGWVGDTVNPNLRYLNSGFIRSKSLFYILSPERPVCTVAVIHEFEDGSTLTSSFWTFSTPSARTSFSLSPILSTDLFLLVLYSNTLSSAPNILT